MAAEWKPRIAMSSLTPLPVQGARSSSPSTSAKPSPSGPWNRSRFSPKRLSCFHALHLEGGEAVGPGVERAFRHGEGGRPDLAHAGAAAGGVREGEVGHHGAGRADFVRVVQVIDVRRVEVHRLLHAAETQHLREEGVVLPRTRGERGDVVEALDLVQHGSSPVRVSLNGI
jgi:hypothetical protein